MGEHDALRHARRAAGGDDEGIAGLDGRTIVESGASPCWSTTTPAAIVASSAALARVGQALVDGEGGVAGVPDVAQHVDERRAAGQVDGDEAPAH